MALLRTPIDKVCTERCTSKPFLTQPLAECQIIKLTFQNQMHTGTFCNRGENISEAGYYQRLEILPLFPIKLTHSAKMAYKLPTFDKLSQCPLYE